MANYNDFDLNLHQIKSNASVGTQPWNKDSLKTQSLLSMGCSASDMTACDICEEAVNSKAARC
jgi:hypothetical protein